MKIDGRPAIVDRRSRYGDWEGDTLVGAARKGGPYRDTYLEGFTGPDLVSICSGI